MHNLYIPCSMLYTQPDVYEFISRQTNDPIVERKTCRVSGTKFPIFKSDLEFYDKISPVFTGEKYQVPTPTLCPEERFRRRAGFRNSLSLYRRKCDATQRDIVSMYKPDPANIVYDNDVRRSDSRNALSYGKNFDFTKTFTEQFRPHRQQVPKMARVQQGENENAIYTNTAANNKDCYLLGDATNNEHCFYGLFVDDCTRCVDNYAIVHGEHAYESILCGNNYMLFYSIMIDDSHHIYHCRNIQNCSYMFACAGMVHAEYCILNKQVDKATFEELLQDPVRQTKILEEYHQHLLPATPLVACDLVRCEQVYGNNMMDSKQCYFCDLVVNCEDCKYCFSVRNMRSSQDITNYGVTNTNELLYEGEGIGHGAYRILFSKLCRGGSRDLLYCYECCNCTNCFGCVGMRNQEYCIFNKQYTKDDYEKIVAKIISHMQTTPTISGQASERGEFLDPQLSPFGYNESRAMDIFPLTKDEALARGYKWSDYEYHINIPENAPVIKYKELTDQERCILRDDDSIINKILLCEVSGKPFRIIKQELEFYRKHDLPLPRKHPDLRHKERLAKRSGITLHLRTCHHCKKEMLSVYPDGTDQPIYCEGCYVKQLTA